MALTNQPPVTDLQVGAYAYFVENNIPKKALVEKTESIVTDTDGDDEAEVVVIYYLSGYTKPFASEGLYSSKGNLKTALDALCDAL